MDNCHVEVARYTGRKLRSPLLSHLEAQGDLVGTCQDLIPSESFPQTVKISGDWSNAWTARILGSCLSVSS